MHFVLMAHCHEQQPINVSSKRYDWLLWNADMRHNNNHYTRFCTDACAVQHGLGRPGSLAVCTLPVAGAPLHWRRMSG